MSLISEVRAYLLADASIAAQVVTRIRPRRMDQGESLPAIRLAIADGREEKHLAGSSTLAHVLLSVDCYAETSATADALDELCRLRMKAIRGSLATIVVRGVSMSEGPRHDEEPINEEGSYRYITGRDWRLSFRQA